MAMYRSFLRNIICTFLCFSNPSFAMHPGAKYHEAEKEYTGFTYAPRLAFWQNQIAKAVDYERKINGGLSNLDDQDIAAHHKHPYIFDKNYLGLAVTVYENWRRQSVKAFYTPGVMICQNTGEVTKGVFAIGQSQENSLIYHRFLRPESQFGPLTYRAALPSAVVKEYRRRTDHLNLEVVVVDAHSLPGAKISACQVTFAYPDGSDKKVKESYYVQDKPYGVIVRVKDATAFANNPYTYVALK